MRATGSWSGLSTWTANLSATSTAGHTDAVRARQNDTIGGSSVTDVNDVAVNPAGGSSGTVTTTTAAACRRNSALKWSAEIMDCSFAIEPPQP